MDAQETNLFSAVLIISLVLGFIIIFFIISVVRQQRKNLQLYRQNILAEITALEKERARISADLHDELGPMLAAVKLRINSFELKDEEDKIQMAKTNEHIDGLIRRIREISYDLLPTTLARNGLVKATKEFVAYTMQASQLKFHLQMPENIDISEHKSIHIFRIVQEIIHNTLKHANATDIKIIMEVRNGLLILLTSDNGIGFDYHAASKSSSGIGLKNLLSRTEIIGGVMYIESGENTGTKYSFEIPLKK